MKAILKINQLIFELNQELETARNEQDFSTCANIRAQIYGLQRAVNIIAENQ